MKHGEFYFIFSESVVIAANCIFVLCMQSDEKDAFESLGTGNRIATWLYYVSGEPH